jgi:hypothetical protein
MVWIAWQAGDGACPKRPPLQLSGGGHEEVVVCGLRVDLWVGMGGTV